MASPVSDDQGHQASQTGYNEQSQNTPVCGPENEPDNESSSLLFLFETWNTKGDESAPCHKDIVEHFCNKQLNSNEKLQLYSTVLDVNVSEDQRKDAVAVGVILIPPKRKKNTNPERDPPTLHWLFYHEIYYPQLRNVLKNVKYVVGYKSITERAAEEIQEGLFPNARLELIDLKALPPPPGALFVFTTWDKSHLGLSQYHRTLVQDFCARKAEIGEVLKVYSTLLSIGVSKGQKEDAGDCSVTLIQAQRKKRATPEEDPVQHNWLLNHEIHYPDLKKLRNIHYVVGYAPNTGKAAADIKEHIFPEAKLYLINHKHSEDDSLPLTSNPSQSNFDDNMLELAQEADLVFSIGPSMYNYFDNKYRAITSADKLKTIPHVQLLPKPRPCFFNETVQLQNEVRNHVIISYGKVDLKKLDNYETLASAVDKAGRSRYENHAGIPTWEVCSVHTIDAEKVSEIIQKLKGSHCKLQVKEVSTAEQLVKDLKQSHLCLAKRDEDYGFHGLEAMAIGLPILADDDSQLAQFIKDYFPDCMDYCILRRDEKRSEKIMNMISHTNTAFQQARKLKMTYMMSEAVAKSYATFAAMFLPQIQNQNCLEVYINLKDLDSGHFIRSLRNRVIEVLGNEKTRQEVEDNCRKSVGDVGIGKMRPSSLVIPIRFPQLLNLYRLKGACKSDYLAGSMEPILLTEEMKKDAEKMNMKLKLVASYDQKKFEEVESFFLNRDGGGVEPMVIQDVIEERHMDEHKFGGIPGYNNQRTYFKSAKQEQNTDVFSATRKSVDPFPRHRKAFDSEAKERQEANLQPRIITDGDGLNPRERKSGDFDTVELVDTSENPENIFSKAEQPMLPVQPVQPVLPIIRTDVGETASLVKAKPLDTVGYFAKIRYGKEAKHEGMEIPIDLDETISDLAKKVKDRSHRFPLIPEDQRLVRKEHAEIQIYERNSFSSSMNFLANQTKLSTVNYKMLEFDIRTGPSRHNELKDDITRNVCGQNIALFGYDGSGKSSLINTFYRALKGQYVQVAQVFPKGGFERGTRVYANCSFKFGDKTLSWNEVPGLTFRNVGGHSSRKLSEHVLSGKAKRNKPVRLPRVPSFRRPRGHEKIHAIVYVHDSTKDTHVEGIQATLGRVRVLPKYGQGIPMFIILTHTDLPVHATLEENLSAFCEDSGINASNVFRVPYYDQEQERKGDDTGFERDVVVLSILKTIVTEAKIYKERGGADVVST